LIFTFHRPELTPSSFGIINTDQVNNICRCHHLITGAMADNQPASSSVQEPLADNQPAAEPTQPAIGAQTVGAGLISKKQPWGDLVQQQTFAQPGFFTSTPSADSAEGTDKIRLLAELDSKSR
jgi:hypothetical protein